jgi:hypothetical protein
MGRIQWMFYYTSAIKVMKYFKLKKSLKIPKGPSESV